MRILVVDDNVDAARSLEMLLRILGHEVSTAPDGLAALDAIETRRPEVVLLDIGLPGLNGYDVARRVRGQPWGKAIRLIALSGWGRDEDMQRGADAGFDAHLVKPADPTDIERLLESFAAG
jgi:CheY-like chemotaxis protein